MDALHASARFPNIAADHLEEFKQLAAEAKVAAQSEPGTLRYDWFVSAAGTECVVLETYRDSDAVLAHVGNVGPLLGRLVELGGGMELQVFGEPSAALRDVMSAFQPVIYSAL